MIKVWPSKNLWLRVDDKQENSSIKGPGVGTKESVLIPPGLGLGVRKGFGACESLLGLQLQRTTE